MTPTPAETRVAFADWQARTAANPFDADPHFQALIRRHRPELAPRLRAFAATCAGEIDALARSSNRDENLPRLERWDGQGNRVERVVFHPDHHGVGERLWPTGVMACLRDDGNETEALAFTYLLAQSGEAGHACPLACTAGMIKILREAGEGADWLDRLCDPAYATRWHASQFLTEVQGGSDVGANVVEAVEGPDGWRIHGEKWFCSVIDARLFLVTARPRGAGPGTGGLRAFVVPRERDGAPNGFTVRRLKYKLGTRSMASAEVDFSGAWGVPVGDFRRVVEVVLNTSRVFNATCAAAFLQRSAREAHAWAATRFAFGRPILDFPSIARTVARLRTEAAAARAVTFALAAMTDAGDTGPAWRMLVNLNKVWTALACPQGVREAIEVLGGNGTIEDFSVLPRLLRDSLVLEAWEGGHGVLCAQILRDAERGMMEPAWALFAQQGVDVGTLRARWRRASPDTIRDLVEELRGPVQAAYLASDEPLLAEHHRITTARGWDPLEDGGLAGRVRAISDPV
jgi:alkylation response protein AidB-like acyl-CoA dehydrogenase